MKKLTKKSVLVLGLFASMFTFAHGEVNPIKEKEPKVTSVSFKKVKLGSKLSIKDEDGIVLYKESIVKAGDYSKGFDLTTLPNGDYYFELDSELKIVVIPFNVVSNQVVFKKEEKSTIFKPYVRVKDDMVFVSRVSYEESPMEFNIYYAENYDFVLSEKVEDQVHLGKIYDFSEAK
jgi:outer membrane lipoprotein-sorting protein